MGCSISTLTDEPSAASCSETTASDVDRHNHWTGTSNPVNFWPISTERREPREHVKEAKPRDPTNGWGYVMARPHDPEKRRRGEIVKGGRTIGERLEAQEVARRKRREEREKKDETAPAAEPAAEPVAESEAITPANAAVEGHDRASTGAEAGNAANEPTANGGTGDASSTVAHAGSEVGEAAPAEPNEPPADPAPAPAPAPAPDPAPAPVPVAAPAPVPIPAVPPEVAAGIAALSDLLAALTSANVTSPPAAAAAAPAPEPADQNHAEPAVNENDEDDGSAIDWADQPPRRAERYPRREMQRLRVIEQQREEERYWRERRDRRVHWDPPEAAGAE